MIFFPLRVISIAVIVTVLLFLNALQTLGALLWLVSPKLFQAMNRNFARFWFWLSVTNMRVFHRLKIKVTWNEHPVNQRENVFVILNHQGMVDIPVLITIAVALNRQQDLKWYLKDSLKWAPGVGWGMKFLDQLFVKRNWAEDKDKIAGVFARLKKGNLPFWIVSFVEGTRITETKLRKSQEIAREKKIYEPKFTLLPRTKGFTATLEGIGDRMDAIYDFTIAYSSFPPKGLLAFFLLPQQEIQVYARRIPIQEVPKTADEQVAWLYRTFELKDRALERFQKSCDLAQGFESLI